MTAYDYGVLIFYFVYMLAISWVFRKFVTNVSDYFRGGGKALWWMVGGSAFMAAFSAWTFTGAASKAYTDGWPVMMIFVANAIGFVLNAIYFAPRFRQLAERSNKRQRSPAGQDTVGRNKRCAVPATVSLVTLFVFECHDRRNSLFVTLSSK